VRPGAIPFVFAHSFGPHELLARLHATAGWGEIVGPHGSGKSTLLHWLRQRVEAFPRPVVMMTIDPDQNDLLVPYRVRETWGPGTQLLVDGFERLAWWRRHVLIRLCRRRRLGLVVTAHRHIGLPLLRETEVTPDIARQIVTKLLADPASAPGLAPDSVPLLYPAIDSLLSVNVLAEFLRQHGGNMRETLFALYDRFEQIERVGRGHAKLSKP
jgi:hypothetical protein